MLSFDGRRPQLVSLAEGPSRRTDVPTKLQRKDLKGLARPCRRGGSEDAPIMRGARGSPQSERRGPPWWTILVAAGW
jgi:hypothetical protein